MWERCFVWEEWDGVKGEMSWGWLHFGVRFFMTWKVSPLISHLLESKPSHRSLAFTS